jgi:hypothetical protein
MTLIEQLGKLGACYESLEWVGEKTIEQAWLTCENSQWMIWFLSQTDLDLVDPVCDMAEEVLDLVPEDSQLACIWAISAARRRANKDELIAASYAITATPAYYYDYDYDAVSRCAVRAADYTANCAAIDVVNVAAYAANASAVAGSSDFYTDRNNEQKKQCDILRKYFTIEQVREAFNKLVA